MNNDKQHPAGCCFFAQTKHKTTTFYQKTTQFYQKPIDKQHVVLYNDYVSV